MIFATEIKGGHDGIIIAKFNYHPLYVNAIKKIPEARYNKFSKTWTIPSYHKAEFERAMREFLIIWDGKNYDINGMRENKIPEYPIVKGYSVTYDKDGRVIDSTGFKTKPWGKFQITGFNAIIQNSNLLLADDTGLGKTFQVITAIEAKKKMGILSRGLVICNASLIYNWLDEIEKHSYQKGVPIVGTKTKREKIYNNLLNDDSWTFAIISYETFKTDIEILKKFAKQKAFDFCVLDEAHKIKNPTSQIGTVIHYIPFKYKYALTATPMPNNLLEIYNYAKWFGYMKDINYYQFKNRFGVMGGYNNKEVIGYKNITVITELLKLIMLRRLKKDKLKELPSITFKTIPVVMGSAQQKLYDGVKNEIAEVLSSTSIDDVTALSKLIRLQQVTDHPKLIESNAPSAKLEALDELVENLVENNEKVIIFSKFKTMTKLFEERYKKYNPAVIHGEVAPKERQQQVYKFQQDNTCKLFIGCSPACREGLTLTASTNVIFYDLEWTPASVEQAYSRAYRIGQKNAVTVYFLICKNTIDEHVLEVINVKNLVSQSVMGSNSNTPQTKTIREIVFKTLKR